MRDFLKSVHERLTGAKWYYWLLVISLLITLSALLSCEYYVEGCRCAFQKQLAFFNVEEYFDNTLVVIATVSGTILALVLTLVVTLLGEQIRKFAPNIDTSDVLKENKSYITIKYSFFTAIITSTTALLFRSATDWFVLLLISLSVIMFFVGLVHFYCFIQFVVNASSDTSNTLLDFFHNRAEKVLDEKE